MKKVSKSFVTGAIALVFAVLGYQTALLVHYSAVSAITAHRDRPDTVYVYESVPDHVEDTDLPVAEDKVARRIERRNFRGRSPVAQKIRENTPPRRIESFRFDPNTVSTEDLVRLGFTPKQAASIDSYRAKGGRFRRKSDFARSYVVSDSVFKRLEPFIDIPLLDINTADSAAFDALPGIGGYFARKMVEYRQRLGGYSSTRQLLEIKNFDIDRYEALKDLIFIGTVQAYPLWTLPEEELRRHPYIGDAARGIVFYREHNPKDRWSIEALKDAGVITEENAARLSECKMATP